MLHYQEPWFLPLDDTIKDSKWQCKTRWQSANQSEASIPSIIYICSYIIAVF